MNNELRTVLEKIQRIPTGGKILLGVLVIGIWLMGQLAFRSSIMEAQNSSVFKKISAAASASKMVTEVVGENVVASVVIADSTKGFIIAKVAGNKGYSFVKANYAGDDLTKVTLKIKDSEIKVLPEYLRGDWVAIKI